MTFPESMDTPICDFVQDYVNHSPLRLHMPGHKGTGFTGMEALDITEIEGADVLYHGDGIIARSEANASSLFGSAATLYSAEGSSLCIRAMLYLAMLHAGSQGKTPRIAAGRNAHKTFLSGVALLDLEVTWLFPREPDGLLTCPVTPGNLEELFASPLPPTAVYVTSPDYLGNTQDIAALAQVCHRHGALLMVDNAHGAYLRFLSPSRHPMDLGADLCCDSAHKTLPVLTGGAYLHISKAAPDGLLNQANNAMMLFASTSPSYLILQSLDRANRYLAEGYAERLHSFAALVSQWKERLSAQSWALVGDEPLKLTLAPKSHGYTGEEISRLLAGHGIITEFADPDYVVMMLSPETTSRDLARVEATLGAIPPRPAILDAPPPLPRPVRMLSPREALFSPQEELPVEEALGRVLGAATVSCPPAIPILVCGERIGGEALRCFRYYGMDTCFVVQSLTP